MIKIEIYSNIVMTVNQIKKLRRENRNELPGNEEGNIKVTE